MKQHTSYHWTLGAGILALCFASSATVHSQVVRGPNGNFYEVVASSVISWDDANNAAQGRSLCGKPGHLATLTSSQENSFVNSLRAAFVSANGGNPQFWIGGYQTDKSNEPAGNWVWVNGEGPIPGANTGPVYSNWAAGEPNDCGGVEDHLTLGRFAYEANWDFDGSLWNDEGCGTVDGYIVEYESANTVIIAGCDSGVPNLEIGAGPCTLSDLIRECANGARNHGAFVSCVAQLTNQLQKDGVITGKQKGAIQSCAAKAKLP